MSYRTTRAVGCDGEDYAEGAPIAFGHDREAVRDQLLALGAIEIDAAVAGAPPPPPPLTGDEVTTAPLAGTGEGVQLPGSTDAQGTALPPVATAARPPAKALSQMKRAELAIAAAKVGVSIAIGMTNKQVIAAIAAKMAGNGK